VVDEAGRIVWRGVVDTHPEALSRALQQWGGKLAKIGLESGSMTPWLVRELTKVGFPVKWSIAALAPLQRNSRLSN
jgi:transposase